MKRIVAAHAAALLRCSAPASSCVVLRRRADGDAQRVAAAAAWRACRAPPRRRPAGARRRAAASSKRTSRKLPSRWVDSRVLLRCRRCRRTARRARQRPRGSAGRPARRPAPKAPPVPARPRARHRVRRRQIAQHGDQCGIGEHGSRLAHRPARAPSTACAARPDAEIRRAIRTRFRSNCIRRRLRRPPGSRGPAAPAPVRATDSSGSACPVGLAGEHRNTSSRAPCQDGVEHAWRYPESMPRPVRAAAPRPAARSARARRPHTCRSTAARSARRRRPARQNARTSRSMPSSLPRSTISCSTRTPYSCAMRSRSGVGCGSG